MRGLLLGIITLGAVTTGVGLTGVVAATTDVAKTGTVTKERAETGVFPVEVDLKLARPGANGVCGTYSDDLTTGIFSINSGTARSFDRTEKLCVKNVGALAKAFRLTTTDVVGSDPICSPDEGAPSVPGPFLGCGLSQLSINLYVAKDVGSPTTCPDLAIPPPASGVGVLVRGLNPGSNPFGSSGLLPVATDCRYAIRLEATNIPYEAQTDVLEWRFQIDVI
jgi:hypothetical protein